MVPRSGKIRATDGVVLESYAWTHPAPAITVALLHGYAEYCGRYRHVAEQWHAAGIQLVGCDLRGHGRSEGRRGWVRYYAELHRDVDALLEHANAVADGGPVAVFGHSNGGLLALHWHLTGPPRALAGMVLSSPFLGPTLHVPPLARRIGHALGGVVPGLGRRSALAGKNVCSDPALQRDYDEDEYILHDVNARWFGEAIAAIDVVHAQAGALGCPTLLLYGGSDVVADPDATDRFAAALQGPDQTADRLSGLAHEIVNEVPAVRRAVIGRMAEWLVAHGRR